MAKRNTRFIEVAGNRTARLSREAEEGHGGSSRTVVRARVQDQLPHDRMYRRGVLDERQFLAADDMHRLYVKSGLVPVRAQIYEVIDNAHPEDAASVHSAKAEYLDNLQLLEPRGKSIVHKVCGEAVITCREWAALFDVSRDYATERLRESLDTIAAYRGL